MPVVSLVNSKSADITDVNVKFWDVIWGLDFGSYVGGKNGIMNVFFNLYILNLFAC